jgi:hypothetical protein
VEGSSLEAHLPLDKYLDSATNNPNDIRFELPGEVAEWTIVLHWKCSVLETVPRVRIPPSPPFDAFRLLQTLSLSMDS